MDTTQLEHRLTELEIKTGFAEDLLDRLNETVFRQQRQIEALVRELLALRRQMSDAAPGGPGGPRDEIPPHY